MDTTIKHYSKSIFLFFFVFAFAVIDSNAQRSSREIGGYVDQAERRFVRNVWNFVKNFQSWQNIGRHRYKEVQYYWAEPFEFKSAHKQYVDKMDLAYVAAHGSEYYVQTNQSAGEGVDLRNAPGYGDLSNGDDLEFMIIESCNTVASAPNASNWWDPWKNSIFKGLHQLVGFYTLSYSDNGIPNRYADKLRANGGVWQSWFEAVNEERQFANFNAPDGSPYPGFASAVMHENTENDRLGNYASDPEPGRDLMRTWWQY